VQRRAQHVGHSVGTARYATRQPMSSTTFLSFVASCEVGGILRGLPGSLHLAYRAPVGACHCRHGTDRRNDGPSWTRTTQTWTVGHYLAELFDQIPKVGAADADCHCLSPETFNSTPRDMVAHRSAWRLYVHILPVRRRVDEMAEWQRYVHPCRLSLSAQPLLSLFHQPRNRFACKDTGKRV
jgi:hypothetical protein